MNLNIRPSEPGDFLEIAALDRIAWKSNSNSEFIPDGEHVWRIWCENALMFTALLEGQIIGAILAFPCLNDTFCIHKVFVHPDNRSQKIGARLFEALNSELDKLQKDGWLTVSPDNESAHKLYGKWGFTHETFYKGYYRSYEDRYVLMRKASK